MARRKLKIKSGEEVRRALDILWVLCPEPVPATVKTHEAALQIAERYKYSIYDGPIIAAALETECNIVHSKDLQGGNQAIENSLTIRNPFNG